MEKSVELIVSKIEELIQAVGGGIKIYYPYVVRQQIIEGLSWLLGMIMCSIILWCGTKILIQPTSPDKEWKDIIGGALILIGIIIFFLLLITFLTDGIGRLLNPHYFAVRDILSMVK